MSLLDEKIEDIYHKVSKLIEQNAQYKRIVEDLSTRNKALETQNEALTEQLKTAKTQQAQLPFDKESLQQQIDKYIQDVDLSIQLISDFE